jgi:magnesium-transporting ATPase (P-type)
MHSIKAQLPRGPENIRKHIKNVDDIPLHVCLFAECSPKRVLEMIKIYQENGEVVCCIGSALNSGNSAAFSASDLAIAIEPFKFLKTEPMRNSYSPVSLGASIFTLSADLTMFDTTSPYLITQLIQEARNYVYRVYQVFSFLCGSYFSLCILQFLSYALCIPPFAMGYELLWITVIILPFLSYTLVLVPSTVPDVMKLLPYKNKDHLKAVQRVVLVHMVKFLPIILMTFLIYLLCLNIYFPKDLNSNGFLKNVILNSAWNNVNAENEQKATVTSQGIASFFFVFYCAGILPSYLYRTVYLWDTPRYQTLSCAMGAICV